MPALASLGLSPWLDAAARSATVMGTSTRFAWCALDDEVVMLSASDAVRFPNAILARSGWERLQPGEQVLIGSQAVIGPALEWRIVRWWDPGMAPVGADPTEVEARVSRLARRVASQPGSGLEAALAAGGRTGIVDAASDLLGAGRGLTPEGDDRLIGAFAAFRHVTASLGRPQLTESLDRLAREVLAVGSRATTRLSVTLLRHALAGQAPEPVADLIRALTGAGNLSEATERCLALGASSGEALAHGVLCGARAGCEAAA